MFKRATFPVFGAMMLTAAACSSPTSPSASAPTGVNADSPAGLQDVDSGNQVQTDQTGIATTNALKPGEPVPRSGWASVTRYRYAETSVQQQVVARATSKIGQSSGQSQVSSPYGSQTLWATDAAGGDGARIGRAINRYHQFVMGRTPAQTLSQVRASMEQELSTYDATRRRLLVDRIIGEFGKYALPGGPSYRTDQAVLTFLGIRRQCLEFAATVGLEAGGQARGYSSTSIADPSRFRPGMALFKADRSHAMLIVDIYWDSNGRPTRYRVVEANWGTGWTNPRGMVPWQRVVSTREVPVGDRVLSFES